MISKINFSKYVFAAALCCIFSFFGGVFLSPFVIGKPTGEEGVLFTGNRQAAQAVGTAAEEKFSSAVTTTSGETFTVVRVIDGDTIDVSVGGKTERVRYIGIDTPETVDPRKSVQCFGREASQKNKELVEGEEVRLEKDITDRDAYGRLLRYVFIGDTFVNRELVRLGYATVYTFPPNVKHTNEFLRAQREARAEQRGLWQVCRSGETTSAVPQTTTSSSSNVSAPAAVCAIKANINARGEKIYHLPGCSYYGKTVIDESKGERWFCAEEEAVRAGWRKAGNCPQ